MVLRNFRSLLQHHEEAEVGEIVHRHLPLSRTSLIQAIQREPDPLNRSQIILAKEALFQSSTLLSPSPLDLGLQIFTQLTLAPKTLEVLPFHKKEHHSLSTDLTRCAGSKKIEHQYP